ncbi:MAG: hybrid sensor histidine kinase/response regulator [Phenylobacterium zucineum]|nr:MAG: hybrid sensor histidine kinase/response regulator [Phenylobacterium zucineum]
MEDLRVSLEEIRPAVERVVKLARAIFDGYHVDIVWRETDKLARLVHFENDQDHRLPSQHVMATRQPIWISDFATDPFALESAFVAGEPGVKCLIAVPICSGDLVLGALGAVDKKVRPRDEVMLRRFADLATLLADAFASVRLAREQAETAARLRAALDATARSEMRLAMATRLAGVRAWELDYEKRQAIEDGAVVAEGEAFDELLVRLWDGVHPSDYEAMAGSWYAHLTEGGGPFHGVYRSRRHQGEYRWVESTAEAIRSPDGRPLRAVGAVRDIDAETRNRAELIEARDAAEAADTAKSAFLATISHEIRTPLNGVLGMAQAMQRDELSPDQRERLHIVQQSGETLLAIVNDVLDLSKIGAGKLALEEVEFDLAAAITTAHATFAPAAAEKGLAFDLEVASSARGVYRGDPVRVRQVLYNLISNAVKFTEAGEVWVRVSRIGEHLALEVSDTGVGIPLERQKALFQPFVQADASTTRKYGGSGLGLSISRELTAMMGGGITLTSAPGRGSTFIAHLRLPYVRPVSGEGAAVVVEAHAEADEDLPPLRVLAAEDNPVNQVVLRTLLEQVGVSPVIVENGRLAVDAWAGGGWDLILMDAQMPVMDGVEATATIRATEAAEGRARTPIIALTANAMPHQVAAYLDCGMDAAVAKPLEVARLFAVMRDVLDAN